MIKSFSIFFMLFIMSFTALSSIPTEEPLTREQFGFIGEVQKVAVEIKSLGQQVLSSETVELVFAEDGYLVSQKSGGILVTYYYDSEKRLIRKVFAYEERILQTISIEYSERSSYTAIAYDDKNEETGRTVYTYDLEKRTLSFTNILENGKSDNLMLFDEKGRNLSTTSYIAQKTEESAVTVNMVVEMNNFYNEAGQLDGRKMILRIRSEGQERSVETSTRVDKLLTDEWGNITREIQRTEYSDGSNPAEEYIYSRLFTYF